MGKVIDDWFSLYKKGVRYNRPKAILSTLTINEKTVKFSGLLSETMENQLLWLASKSGEYKYHQKLKRWYEANKDRVEHVVVWVDGERMILQDFVNNSLGMFWRNGN